MAPDCFSGKHPGAAELKCEVRLIQARTAILDFIIAKHTPFQRILTQRDGVQRSTEACPLRRNMLENVPVCLLWHNGGSPRA